jgi:hypothetical protein
MRRGAAAVGFVFLMCYEASGNAWRPRARPLRRAGEELVVAKVSRRRAKLRNSGTGARAAALRYNRCLWSGTIYARRRRLP